MPQKILFVCLGNICRSPTAEAIFNTRAKGTGHVAQSAGTAGWHTGSPPDPRSIRAGEAHGYDLTGIRSRPVRAADYHLFDRLIAMDAETLETLLARAPQGTAHKVSLMRDHAPGKPGGDIPDPYYTDDGFEEVVTLLEDAIDGLILRLDLP